jgi:hypothetical protein
VYFKTSAEMFRELVDRTHIEPGRVTSALRP